MTRVDRSRLPEPGPDRPFRFPAIAHRRLPNGLAVRAVSHHAVPIVSMALLVPGGASADPADRPGLVSMTAGLLDEGSRGQSALDVADRVARIGGALDLEVGADAVVVSLTTLDRFLDEGLALVHELVTEPNLADADFTRLRDLRLERFRQMRDHAAALAERAFATAVYGTHPYGHLSMGTSAALAAMSVDDTRAMHAALFAADGATLVVAGDRPEEALLDAASRAFEAWRRRPSPLAVDRRAALAAPPATPAVRLGVVPRPAAPQSELRIGHACAARATPDYPALLVLNTVLGGQFVSRLNMNLREQKGYTYGVRTGFDLRKGLGPFVVQTSVGTDVTVAAVAEVLRELDDIAGSRPVTSEELALAQATVTKGYPRGFETAGQVARSVAQLALHDLPDTYFEAFVPTLLGVTEADVSRVARTYLDRGRMATLIVGDLDKIGDSLADLGLGPHQILKTEF